MEKNQCGILSHEEKKKDLYLKQKILLQQFLQTGAISKAQYDKSLSDLTEKMNMKFQEEQK